MNEKKTAEAFDLLTPTAEQKNYMYERILSRTGTAKVMGKFRIKRGAAYAFAATVFMICCTFAASALGIIDLQKAFGGIFKSNIAEMESISVVPENVITSGDNRLTLKVIAIGGTENEVMGAVEITRNDGGTFPPDICLREGAFHIADDMQISYGWTQHMRWVNDTTAVLYFTFHSDESIIGKTATVAIPYLFDGSISSRIPEAVETTENDFKETIREAIVIDGGWSISFRLEYDTDYRVIKDNIPIKFTDRRYRQADAVVTELGYSAISLNITLDEVGGVIEHLNNSLTVTLRLKDGTEITPVCNSFSGSGGGEEFTAEKGYYKLHYRFDSPINIESIESIIINDTEIPLT